MKTTQYLYNIHPNQFKYKPYHEALTVKRDAAHKLVGELLDEALATRDDQRFLAAYSAVKHNQQLLDELND